MAKVSVILPVYNVEPFLGKCIRSVLNQSFEDFELLVLIDGSPDASLQIARSFEDERIKIIEKENTGLSDTRNYGLELAKGEFVYFMDSDDWIEPDLLKEQIYPLEARELDFVVFGFMQDRVNEEGTILWSKKKSPKLRIMRKGEQDLQIDSFHLDLLGYVWNKIYRRSFLNEHQIRFNKGMTLVEDILFNLQVFSHSDFIPLNDKARYHYVNRNRDTLITRFRKDSFVLIKQKISALYAFASIWNIPDKKSFVANALVGGISYCVQNLFEHRTPLVGEEQKTQRVSEMVRDPLTKFFIEFSSYQKGKNKEVVESIMNENPRQLIQVLLG